MRCSETSQLPLVLLPGTLCDERLFDPMVAELGGQSTQVASFGAAQTVVEAAEMVLANAPPRFALLGFSLGAIVALEMAVLQPERLAGLALVAGTARAVPAEQHASRWRETEEAAGPIEEFVCRRLLPSYVTAGGNGDAKFRDLVVAMAACAGGAAFTRQTGIALSRVDRRRELLALSVPTIVVGGAEDRINPPKIQHELAERLTDAQLTLLRGVGHLVPLEAPRRLAGLVAEWLRRSEAAGS